MKKTLTLALLFLPLLALADKTVTDTTGADKVKKTSINYCQDADKAKEWEGMLLKYPEDLGIIKLYALRVGLCKSVKDRKITLDMAIDVFNIEHEKLLLEWAEQEKRDKAIKERII